MNLFRSEEHVGRWLEQNGHEAGVTITAAKLGELAYAWWSDRLAPDWRPHTREQNQATLDRLGLTDSFWRLP
jgi:aryl-alcohol dehydrogenase-like predicted oxidoreductase